MRPQQSEAYQNALDRARAAVRQGDKVEARGWAFRAASIDPHHEDPWLLLAALASPRASVAYCQRALKANPKSRRARVGMRWALRRARANGVIGKAPEAAPSQGSRPARRGAWPAVASVMVILFVLGVALLAWVGTPVVVQAAAGARRMAPLALAQLQPTNTPTPTYTATPSPTPTATDTLPPSPTNTPKPSRTPRPTKTPTEALPEVVLPAGVGSNEGWIDVDLSQQTLTAYRGEKALKTFIVSTGVASTPTVTGQYQIYIKYTSAPMSGPGYYLPDVPYVMYFYGDYGIHGTYWHNNFGTPMSHGCVNMTIEDANWLFDFADVGTWVNIHY